MSEAALLIRPIATQKPRQSVSKESSQKSRKRNRSGNDSQTESWNNSPRSDFSGSEPRDYVRSASVSDDTDLQSDGEFIFYQNDKKPLVKRKETINILAEASIAAFEETVIVPESDEEINDLGESNETSSVDKTEDWTGQSRPGSRQSFETTVQVHRSSSLEVETKEESEEKIVEEDYRATDEEDHSLQSDQSYASDSDTDEQDEIPDFDRDMTRDQGLPIAKVVLDESRADSAGWHSLPTIDEVDISECDSTVDGDTRQESEKTSDTEDDEESDRKNEEQDSDTAEEDNEDEDEPKTQSKKAVRFAKYGDDEEDEDDDEDENTVKSDDESDEDHKNLSDDEENDTPVEDDLEEMSDEEIIIKEPNVSDSNTTLQSGRKESRMSGDTGSLDQSQSSVQFTPRSNEEKSCCGPDSVCECCDTGNERQVEEPTSVEENNELSLDRGSEVGVIEERDEEKMQDIPNQSDPPDILIVDDKELPERQVDDYASDNEDDMSIEGSQQTEEEERLVMSSITIPRISVKDEDGISVNLPPTDDDEPSTPTNSSDKVDQEYQDDWEIDENEERMEVRTDVVEQREDLDYANEDDKIHDVEQRLQDEIVGEENANERATYAEPPTSITERETEIETPPLLHMGNHEQKMIQRLRNIANNLDEQRNVLKDVECPEHHRLTGLRQATVETHGVICIYTEYVRSLTKNVVKISSRLEDIQQTLDEKLRENREVLGDIEGDLDDESTKQVETYHDSLASLKAMVAETLLATAQIEEEIREARRESERRERERREAWIRVERMEAESQAKDQPPPQEVKTEEKPKEEKPEEEEDKKEEDVEYNRMHESMKVYTRMEQIKSWAMLIYKTEANSYNQGVSCVLRASPGTLEQEDLHIARLGQTEAGPSLLDHDEELISDIIVVNTVGDEATMALCEPWALAIPHCAPKTIIAKEVVVKARTSNGWKRLKTQDVVLETFKDLRFAQIDVDCGNLTLAVVWRPRTDTITVGKKGAHVTASADQRIGFAFRPGVLRVNTEFMIKVTSLEVSAVLEIKQRYPDQCQPLLTCSPIIDFLQISGQRRHFVRPITVSVPLPPNLMHRGHGRPGTAMDTRPRTSMFKRPNSAFVIGFPRRRHDQGERTDQVHLVVKHEDSNWIVRDDVNVMQSNKNKDVVSFELSHPIDKFFLMRTTCFTCNASLLTIASSIEEYLQNKSVIILIRQKPNKPNDLVVVCSPTNKVEKIAQNLAEEGYTTGPRASREILLKEGQKLWVYFRGNLRLDHDAKTEFLFNSQMPRTMYFKVRQIDEFAQRCINVYRGFVQVFTEGLVQKSTQTEEKGRGKEADKQEWVMGENLISELVITVPKPAKGPPTPLGRAPLRLRPDGIIDELLLRNIAIQLGTEWRQLASCLTIKRARIQAILREHVNKDSDEVKFEMLLTWAKRVPRSLDKVDLLCTSLANVGRFDLGMEIRQADDLWKRERLEVTDDDQIRKYFVRVAQNRQVMARWQALAFTLGLRDGDIDELETRYSGTRERCLQALYHWKQRDRDASVMSLMNYLRRCGFVEAANEVGNMVEPR